MRRRARKDIRRTHQDGVSDFGYKVLDVVHCGELLPAGLVDAQPVHDGGEFVAVLGPVDVFGTGAQNVDAVVLERERQVVGNLAADAHHHAERSFDRADFQDGLEAELVKVKAVATVVVGGDGFPI